MSDPRQTTANDVVRRLSDLLRPVRTAPRRATGGTTAGGANAEEAVPDSFRNPMTGAGDTIRGGTGGAPVRVAAGAEGDVLTVVGGVPTMAPPTFAGGRYRLWTVVADGDGFVVLNDGSVSPVFTYEELE